MRTGGDVVTKVNGQPVTRDNDFSELITRFQPGDRIALELYRGDERRTATVTLGERPDKVPDAAERAMRELVAELALGLREHVLPHLGSHAGRAHLQAGIGGDVTFAIDEEAEAFLERFLAEQAPDVAYYSEDRGSVGADSVAAGRSGCWSSTRSTGRGRRWPGSSRAAWRSPRPRSATARRRWATSTSAAWSRSRAARLRRRARTGVEIRTADGRRPTADLSPNTDAQRMFWTLGFRGRPAVPLVQVLGELIDASSVGGAVFDLGSAAFDMTRIVTGQLDAYLDVGSRMIEEVPALRARFEQVGGGRC